MLMNDSIELPAVIQPEAKNRVCILAEHALFQPHNRQGGGETGVVNLHTDFGFHQLGVLVLTIGRVQDFQYSEHEIAPDLDERLTVAWLGDGDVFVKLERSA